MLLGRLLGHPGRERLRAGLHRGHLIAVTFILVLASLPARGIKAVGPGVLASCAERTEYLIVARVLQTAPEPDDSGMMVSELYVHGSLFGPSEDGDTLTVHWWPAVRGIFDHGPQLSEIEGYNIWMLETDDGVLKPVSDPIRLTGGYGWSPERVAEWCRDVDWSFPDKPPSPKRHPQASWPGHGRQVEVLQVLRAYLAGYFDAGGRFGDAEDDIDRPPGRTN